MAPAQTRNLKLLFVTAVAIIVLLSSEAHTFGSPIAGADVPELKQPTQPLSIAKEVELANDYLFGHGVAPDAKLSAYWLDRAAKAGDPDAEEEMGYFYEAGIGVAKDLSLAGHWYELAAHGGSVKAKLSLGMLYFWGLGVSRDFEMAAQYFREAAEKGDGMASYELGTMYAEGIGVPRDLDAAERWLAKGAKLRDPQAEYRLGLFYFDTPGHRVDFHKAAGLLRASVASGLVPAMYSLGLLLSLHPELAQSPHEATDVLDAGSSSGLWRASEVLGLLERDGRGVPQDAKSAYFHFRVAALQGGAEAQKALEPDLRLLSARLGSDECAAIDAQAEAWYQKHHLVLQFVYKPKDSRARLPAFALAAPQDGEHVLQLLPETTNE